MDDEAFQSDAFQTDAFQTGILPGATATEEDCGGTATATDEANPG